MSLHEALRSGNVSALQSALTRGFSVDVLNADRWTPLHFGVLADQVSVVRLLASRRVNVSSRTADGHTGFHFAAQVGHELLIILLVEDSASVDAKNSKDQIPLHDADTSQSLAYARLLVDSRSKVTATNAGGFAPLHIGTYLGAADIVNFLPSVRAKPNHSQCLWSPIHLAKLLEHGGDANVGFAQKNPTPPNRTARMSLSSSLQKGVI
jgi:ankyrin repeat protein